MTTKTYTVKLSPRNFNTGLKYAKKMGGKFNPSDKTWTITLGESSQYHNYFTAPAAYGFIVLGNAASSTTKHHDGNCPAHFGGACECDAYTG
jgi:hypothetical protein